MSKTYEDLSRRALIKLGHDYDQDSKGELKQYLDKHQDQYEDIRPIETLVQRTDQLVETVSKSAIGVRTIINAAANKTINKAADIVIANADAVIGNAANSVASKITF